MTHAKVREEKILYSDAPGGIRYPRVRYVTYCGLRVWGDEINQQSPECDSCFVGVAYEEEERNDRTTNQP